jgi:HEAT repeat protein
MRPLTVFFRTLLKSSAIFIGTAAIFLHPQLDFRSPAPIAVGARQAAREQMIDDLIAALKDSDAGVRRQVARTLAQLNSTKAVPALAAAMKDADPDMRAILASALGELGDARGVPALRDALKDEVP